MIYSEVIQPDTAGPLPAHSPMRFRLPPARLTLDYGLSPAAVARGGACHARSPTARAAFVLPVP